MHFLHEVLSKEREIKLLERRMKNNGRGKRRKKSEKKESEVKNNISRQFARNIKNTEKKDRISFNIKRKGWKHENNKYLPFIPLSGIKEM